MNILYTAFNGKTNSSKLLLDLINCNDENKLYVKNSFNCINQLQEKIKTNTYDLIISFGQAPINKNTIKIETRGKKIDTYDTNFNYINLKQLLENNKFNVKISNNAGTYLCNDLYYNGLKYIKENNLKSKLIFIHIPKIKNIDNLKELAKLLERDIL